MGPTATFIAYSYSAVTIIACIIAIGVWKSTRGERKFIDPEKAAHREKGWLAIVVAFLVTTLLLTIFLVPYGESAGPDAQKVEVIGRQFAFQITPATVKVGQQVEFTLTSADTTHGFGVEYPTGGVAFQAQIVPEHTQRVVWTFKEPGKYPVVCLEYCGVGHHIMTDSIEVTP